MKKSVIMIIVIILIIIIQYYYNQYIIIQSYYYTGPPKNLIVHGIRDKYTPIPEQYRKTFQCEAKGCTTIIRAFRNRGWTHIEDKNKQHEIHIYYRAKGVGSIYFQKFLPWQRYSRIPGSTYFESKDKFLQSFQYYQKHNPDKTNLYFIPETYRLIDENDKKTFQNKLLNHGGMNYPWVLKKVNVNNGQGIEILPPNSIALQTAIQRSVDDTENDYIIQTYICNELTWYRNEKFDLRFYWMVASIDPLIVLYHDGYVRIGGSQYNETDFTNTAKHLTNHAYRSNDQEDAERTYLWKRIREHYNTNYKYLTKTMNIQIDPVEHVRNQMREAIATTAAALQRTTFNLHNVHPYNNITTENLFAIYGCDFIIDSDLDVYYIEAQSSPGFGEKYDYRVELFRELYRPVPDIIEEIAIKQQTNSKGNILPIQSLGKWEIVYAGNWMYQYNGYKRSTNKKSCTPQYSNSKSKSSTTTTTTIIPQQQQNNE